MKVFKAFLEIFSTTISLTSIIFMGIVFWFEVHGHSVTYYEPNYTIAMTELILCAFGFGTVLGSFIRKLRA